jgi:DNA-binding transcriptional ArsR family regulator
MTNSGDGRDPCPRARRCNAMSERNGFDELIHPATRLSIVALLAAADWAEFAFVRDQLGLSDSALSKQLSTLEEAGYVAIERPVSERRRRVRAASAAASAAATPSLCPGMFESRSNGPDPLTRSAAGTARRGPASQSSRRGRGRRPSRDRIALRGLRRT